MSVTITNFGNLVKIDTGNGIAQYFENDTIPTILQIDPNSLRVRAMNGNLELFEKPLAQVSINGSVPASLSDFEIAIDGLVRGFLFSKLDPLVLAGYASIALTSKVRRMAILGNNSDVDTGTVPETVWPGGGLYPWMTGATSLEVVSTSIQDSATGTGISAISMTLLDINYVASAVTVSLAGTTPVAISGTWFRINGAFTTIKGSGAPATRAFNIGDIIIRDAGGGTTRAIIQAGKGIARQAVFTVEAGYTLQILSHYISLNRGTGGGGGVTKYLSVSNFIQTSTGVSRTPLDISCDGEPYRHDGTPGVVIPEKTDYALEAIAVSADNSDVTAAFLGLLMKNDLVSTITY